MPVETEGKPSTEVTDETSISIADYRKERMGEKPVTEPGKEVTPAQPPVTEASKTAQASEPAKPQEKKEGQEAGETAEKPESSYRKLQRRFDQLTREKGDLQRRVEELEKKPATVQPAKPAEADPKPEQKDFKTWEEFNEATVDWKVRQALKAREEKAVKDEQAEAQADQQTQRQQIRAEYSEAVEDMHESHPDWEKTLEGLEIPQAFYDAILDYGKKGPELAYQLAKQAKEKGAESSQAKILEYCKSGDYREAWIEFGVFVRSLSQPKTPAKPPEKPVSTAPTPITPVGTGSGATEVDSDEAIDKMSTSDYRKMRASGRIR